MKTRLAWILCLLMLWTLPGMAEETQSQVGAFARDAEEAAIEQGLEVRTDVTFEWGGLPLLDEQADKALGSMLGATAFQQRRQSAEGNGYMAFDMLLQDVSVLDVVMQATDGVYYEQSNLTGGQTLAFTEDEFGMFASRLSARTENVLPPDMDFLYTVVMDALSGTSGLELDADTIDGAIKALNDWTASALTETDRLRPKMSIPGLYGLRESVIDVTRDEAIALAKAYTDLLAENKAIWQDAVIAQSQEDMDAAKLDETVLYIGELLESLPELLSDALPNDIKPAEYRFVYGPDDNLVAKQLDIKLPEDAFFYLEWVPHDAGVPAVYLSFAMADVSMELLVTQENGEPEVDGRISKQRDRTIAQMTFIETTMQLDVVMTRTKNIETRADKETITVKTDWMMESAALFGEGAVITLTSEATNTASGSGKDYTAKGETVWRLKGLGFDTRDILKVKTRATVVQAELPVDMAAGAVHPAQLDEESFDQWLAETQVSMMQAGFTVLGRLPPDVAAYVLSFRQ